MPATVEECAAEVQPFRQSTSPSVTYLDRESALTWIFHTPVEQKADRRVGKLVNTQLYADTRDRLSFDRL
jgi:hypothetical protein